MSSGLPWATVPKDRVEDGEELPQRGNQGDLRRMPGGAEALVEGGQGRVMASGSERGHVEHPTHGTPAPPDGTPAPEGATVLIERCDAHQGGDLPAIEPPQFREFGDERRGGDRTDTGHGCQQILRLPPR